MELEAKTQHQQKPTDNVNTGSYKQALQKPAVNKTLPNQQNKIMTKGISTDQKPTSLPNQSASLRNTGAVRKNFNQELQQVQSRKMLEIVHLTQEKEESENDNFEHITYKKRSKKNFWRK
ncbi:hypothetical protein JTB14_003896 [Gonioctena quinquepunctata]|nr:hypothetical protein JTB14_003896 [Gonioctena quinquepunctata]